jgi:hypothetical protein
MIRMRSCPTDTLLQSTEDMRNAFESDMTSRRSRDFGSGVITHMFGFPATTSASVTGITGSPLVGSNGVRIGIMSRDIGSAEAEF